MVMLPVKRGLSSPAVASIPEQWDRQWFRYFIDNFLTNADIRNVSTGTGITISGNVSGDSTSGSPSGVVTIAQSPIASNTVLGNISGISQAPVALSQAQLTTLINLFTPTLSGAVLASGGGIINFLRADGVWASPVIPIGADPTTSIGLTAINGTATTFLRSDGAQALNQGIVPTWLGIHTFSARSAFNAGTTITGLSATVAAIIVSGLSGSTSGADLSIRRAGSTANVIEKGPSLDLSDSTATTASSLQHSGGQFELWMTQNNGVLWSQVLKVLTTNGVVINTPTSGDTLTLSPSVTSGALVATSAALTTGAGASTGTLTNAPSAGNPTKWIKINDNGTIRSFPAW